MKKTVFTLRLGTGPATVVNRDGKVVPTTNKIASGIIADFRRHLPKEEKNA